MKTIIITGGSGMVGSNLIKYLTSNRSYNLICLFNDHPTNFDFCKNIKVNIANKKEVLALESFNPHLIIHCAALTNIEFCEQNPRLANKINVTATKNIIQLSNRCNSKVIYLSTDAVFDGKKGNYTEGCKTNPLNIYGKTKLEGETICLKHNHSSLVIRTNVFGTNVFGTKLSFMESIIDNLRMREVYPAFNDSIFSPVSVDYLSKILVKLYDKNINGIVNVANSESITKYDFAKLVAEVFGFNKNLINSSSINTICKFANRAKNTSLDNFLMLNLLKLKDTPTIKQMIVDFNLPNYFENDH